MTDGILPEDSATVSSSGVREVSAKITEEFRRESRRLCSSLLTRILRPLPGILFQFSYERTCGFRYRYVSAESVVPRNTRPIYRFVSTLVRMHDGSVQAHTSKNSFAAQIGQNFLI